MAQHISMRDKVRMYLTNIENLITKETVKSILPLLSWTESKIQLIMLADNKKWLAKQMKIEGKKPIPPLQCSRGEIWDAFLGYNIGSEQNGVNEGFSRPVLIVQNEKNNKFSPNTIIVPLSKIENRNDGKELSEDELQQIKQNLRKTEILLYKNNVKENEKELSHNSIVLCQNIRDISKERLDFKITHINDDCWKDINVALKNSLGID